MFSVVLDKICVFCLYPIPDSQQYVKRDSCRRLILSGLLCLFSFWVSGPFVASFEFEPRTLSFSFCLLWRGSNLGLEPCPFLFAYFILFESFESLCVSYLFCVYFVFNCYLSLKIMLCHFVSCLVLFFVFIYVKCHLCEKKKDETRFWQLVDHKPNQVGTYV